MPSYYTQPRYLPQRPIGANNAPGIPVPDDNIPPFPEPGVPPGYANPYDPRIGNGALPRGIYGAADRAYTRDVQGGELAATHISALLNDRNSAYMRNARQSGVEFANRRGLGNSSIAAGNSQRSAIEAGAPIALSDADAYRQAAGQNLDVLNRRQLADIDTTNQQMNRSNELSLQRMGDESALMRQRENLAYSGEQAGLDRVQERDVIGLRGEVDDWLDSERSGRNYYYDSRTSVRQEGRENRASLRDHELGLSDYQQRTGIDLRAQNSSFGQQLLAFALENPHLVSPEVLGAFRSFGNEFLMEDLASLFGRRP